MLIIWTMLLFRPIGLAELRLVALAGWHAWPPRLAHQPIFYPVLTLDYARKIARDWNTVDEFSGFIGFVTRFSVDDRVSIRYPVQVAGGTAHEELWVPAEELEEFNRLILGHIEVIETFVGTQFVGELDPVTRLPAGTEPPR